MGRTATIGTGTDRWLLCALIVSAVLFVAPASAGAHACGLYPVCPYQHAQVLGGSDPASLDGPLGVAHAPGGNVVIADYAKQSVREFDRSGHLLKQIGTPGEFGYLHEVATDPTSGEIYAEGSLCIYWFKASGSADGKWCGDPSSQLAPTLIGLAAGPHGTVYTYGGSGTVPEIDELSAQRTLIRSWAVPLAANAGIATDAQGNVYVPIAGGVDVYDPSGALISAIHLPVDPDGLAVWGSTLYVESSPDAYAGPAGDITAYDMSGNPVGAAIQVPGLDLRPIASFQTTPEFAVDASGIVVTVNHQALEFGLDGTPTGSWGSLAVDDFTPEAVLGDAAGDVYVVDIGPGHARVVKYGAGGGPAAQLVDLSPYFDAYPLVHAVMDSRGNLVIDDWDKVVTVDQAGNIERVVTLACVDGCGGAFAVAPNSDIYAGDFQHVDRFAPDGTLIGQAPVWGPMTIDANGDAYLTNGNEIFKYGPSGQPLASWPNADVEFDNANALTVAANGDIYTASSGGVRIYQPGGALVAAWPYSGGSAGAISVAANGDVLIAPAFDDYGPGVSTGVGAGGTQPPDQVTRYYDLLRPLPPLPPAILSNRVQVSHIRPHPDGTTDLQITTSAPGSITLLETAWKDNRATAANLLQPAPRRFIISRQHVTATGAYTFYVHVRLNARGRRLLRHHRYRVVFRLWVSFTPLNGRQRNVGVYGLHFSR
jgi:hypothetical protein